MYALVTPKTSLGQQMRQLPLSAKVAGQWKVYPIKQGLKEVGLFGLTKYSWEKK